LKILFSFVVLFSGIGMAWVYSRRTPATGHPRFDGLLGDRPWRRLGAGICLLLAVMFVIGVWVVDKPQKPVPYAVFWIIIMALTVWLCVLAVKDVIHTRRVFEQWREERQSEANVDLHEVQTHSDEAVR